MSAKPKFEFYEKVIIIPNEELPEISGKVGFIFGRSEGSDKKYVYTVSLEENGVCWCIAESHLSSLGQILKRDDFYE